MIHDTRQFDMFAELEPPPELPMRSMWRDRWEMIAIQPHGDATDAKIEASSSGLSLSTSDKVLRPFRFRGFDWVQTGACYHHGNVDRECYRVLPLADFSGPGEALVYHDHDFFGEHREQLGGYHAMKAKNRGADVVLVGPPIVMVLRAAGA